MRKNQTIRILTLVGRTIKIRSSSDPSLEGLKGVILNETKNTITIRNDEKKIMVPKKTITFELYDHENKITIKGEDVIGTLEDRVKKIMRRK